MCLRGNYVTQFAKQFVKLSVLDVLGSPSYASAPYKQRVISCSYENEAHEPICTILPYSTTAPNKISMYNSKAYLEPSQTSTMVSFCENS